MNATSSAKAKDDQTERNRVIDNPWVHGAAQRALEENGVEFPIHEYGWKVVIGRLSTWNPSYKEGQSRVINQPKFAALINRMGVSNYELTDTDKKLTNELGILTFCHGCIRRWNVTDEDGKPLELNDQNFLKFADTFPDLADKMVAFSQDANNYEPKIDNAA